MLRSRFTEMLDLQAPLMSAPMSLHTGPHIAAAVSSAGALGTFGGWNPAEGPEWMSAQIAEIRAATDRPFGVGFISHLVSVPLLEAVLADRVPVVVFSFDDPTVWVEQAKAAGATVICQVQTLAGADLAVEAGTDILITQGAEAGGHTGTMSLLPFLATAVARFPDVPVLAAGGIANGRALAAVLTAGADGALLGTPFLATPEAVQVQELHKRLIVESDGTDTVFTRAYDILGGVPWPEGIGMRTHRNRFTDNWGSRETELREHHAELARTGGSLLPPGPPDPETYPFPYGQGAGAVTAIRPAAEVIEMICGEAEEVLRTRPPSLLG